MVTRHVYGWSIMRQEAVYSLWDDLSDRHVSKPDEATAQFMSALCDLVGAWNATWAGAVQFDRAATDDPLQGWRVGAMQALHPVEPHPDDEHFKEILKVWDRREIDPSFLLPMRGVGTFRTYSFRRELPKSWFNGPFYNTHYGSMGTHDAVFVAFPLNGDCESHFGFYSRRRFTDSQIDLLTDAIRGIKWFHRARMMSSGLLVASSPLTPTERRVLHFLLSKASETEIAAQLDLAGSTTHQHVKSIFRKFGVRSRAALMSLWFGMAG